MQTFKKSLVFTAMAAASSAALAAESEKPNIVVIVGDKNSSCLNTQKALNIRWMKFC
ncbi:hypothetical protein BCV09_20750 [Vibrio cyclitrophicus]|uniref:hypothetical protein n=1 Tax=Vibrio TaxID=662 RepID=UPI0002FE11A9|nr:MULTISPECIES: hypothetical protein [Vibrio]KAA8602756.1 Arylsulfatase [Vibrio cyclitrophicus]MDH5878033.1 hypothetical protein [Vibrio sp. S/42/10]UPR27753.1 hypothetical protein ITG08_17040 [Vibrio cyclitrophicus]